MSVCGVWTVLNDACSCKVRMLIACCVTRRWCGPGGGACGHSCILVNCLSMVRAAALRSGVISGAGMTPSVLFLTTNLCRHLVLFNTHLAAGFLVFMIIGKFVRCGIVMVGVSLITLYLSLCMRNCISFTTHGYM
jgi:hypothetical protein